MKVVGSKALGLGPQRDSKDHMFNDVKACMYVTCFMDLHVYIYSISSVSINVYIYTLYI